MRIKIETGCSLINDLRPLFDDPLASPSNLYRGFSIYLSFGKKNAGQFWNVHLGIIKFSIERIFRLFIIYKRNQAISKLVLLWIIKFSIERIYRGFFVYLLIKFIIYNQIFECIYRGFSIYLSFIKKNFRARASLNNQIFERIYREFSIYLLFIKKQLGNFEARAPLNNQIFECIYRGFSIYLSFIKEQFQSSCSFE